MRLLYSFLVGFGAVGIGLYAIICLGFVGLMLASYVYGMFLAFSASVILGILLMFVFPGATTVGLVAIFFHKDLAQMIVDFLTK